jgi:hypothetical protein
LILIFPNKMVLHFVWRWNLTRSILLYAWPIIFFVTPISNNPLAIMYGAFKDECHFGCNGSSLYFLWNCKIEIELKWRRRDENILDPKHGHNATEWCLYKILFLHPYHVITFNLSKCTSISKLLKFGRKKPISLFINFVAQRLSIQKRTTSICKVEHCFSTISNDNHPLFMMKHTFDIMMRHTNYSLPFPIAFIHKQRRNIWLTLPWKHIL